MYRFQLSLKRSQFLAMLATRQQKAKEKRSRHSDVMSDIENLEIMLRTFPKNDSKNEPENERGEADSAEL